MSRRQLPTFPQQQHMNPHRHPAWRWQRANHLYATAQYYSRKRDDEATGIAVGFLRDIDRCRSELRLRRVRRRYSHLARANDIWQAGRGERLELEMRILARQTDTAIGLELDLPAATIQAYRDIFFHIDDRIESATYIMHRVIGIRPDQAPTPVQFAMACAYHHGPVIVPLVIEYLDQEAVVVDLSTAAGRSMAALELLHRVLALPDCENTQRSFVKCWPVFAKTLVKNSKSVSAAAAFRRSTDEILAGLEMPHATLPALSYALPAKTARHRDKQIELRKAA